MHVTSIHCESKAGDEGGALLSSSDTHHTFQDDTTLVALLKAFAKQRDLYKGIRLHADILQMGLARKNVFIGCALVNMYAKCGALAKAQHVFDELPIQNVVSWNALIAGYVEHDQGNEALDCLERMKHKGLSPDVVTLSCTLKACSIIREAEKGKQVHDEIIRYGFLGKNIVLANALLDMYAKCGVVLKAQQVLDELPIRNVVSWTALMSGYCQQGYGEEAITCFRRMQREGLSPNAVTFTCILKVCNSIGAVEKGIEIHAEVARKGLLEKNSVLGTALVDMYAKYGALLKAQQMFDELPLHDVVTWTALISGYAQHGHDQKALYCCTQMQHEGLSPNAMTFACMLKVCGNTRAAEKGIAIHALLVKKGLLGNDIVLGNALVDMYAKNDDLVKAQEMFDELSARDRVSWTTLIVGYCEHGHCEKAVDCLERMKSEGLSPDESTLLCILQSCGSLGAIEKGNELYAEISRKGLVEKHTLLGTALVDMYAKCGALASAQQLFGELPLQDLASWNALITGYYQHGHSEKALDCLEQMQVEGLSPDVVTKVCILQACGSIRAVEKGEKIHAKIAEEGFLPEHNVLGNALMDMYMKCGALVKAQKVFEKLCNRDVVSWNVLMAGYWKYGHGKEALNCLEQMQNQGFPPDGVTFACILKGCGITGVAESVEAIHAEIVKEGFLGKDFVLGNSLVDVYAKCGALAAAQQVFDKLLVRDAVSWTALITGFCQQGYAEEALSCFQHMQSMGITSDSVTFTCILKACGSIGAIERGKKIHTEVVRKGLSRQNLVLGTAVVDMYAKCGVLAKAREEFDNLSIREVVSWTVLIDGYAQAGKHETVLNLFTKMIREGIEPSAITFIVVLNACSYFGLVDEGQIFYESMSSCYGMIPTVEHHTCMVDLFGRSGHLDKAIAVIKKTPSSDTHSTWFLLLGACHKWGNLQLGRLDYCMIGW